MEIAVLGTGCAKCKTVYRRVKKVVEENKIAATVKKEEDITEIIKFSVMVTPAVVIDGTVVMQGGLPKENEIKEWLSKKNLST